MFDFVRSHTKLLQGLLVLLIFPSFVFFGVQGYSSFTDKGNATVAKVDGQPIKQTELDAAHRQQIDRYRQQMPTVDIKLLDTPAMRQQTLDALVRERVLLSAVNRDHLTISDERLHRLFVQDNQYAMLRRPDGSVNKEILAAQGMSSQMFAEQLRQDFSTRQVLGGVTGSTLVGQTVMKAAVNALLEQREFQFQRFDSKEYLARQNPTDAEIEAFYKSHTSLFRSAEEASIEYAVLDLDALRKQLNLADADLQKYYEENAGRYTSAEERRASHILINAPKDAPAADRTKARAKAEALLADLRKKPEAFAEMARKNSEDTGSAEKGGDLDFFGRGAMVKPFEDAAFAMKTGEISPIVESEFGFHIIQLVSVRGGERKPFAAVRAEIIDEVGKQQAQKLFAGDAEQFTNMVFEQSDSLDPVLAKLKLSKQTAVVRRTPAPGAAGPLASAKLLEAVFGTDAVKNKRNTEAVETGPNQLVSARVVEYRPERVQPLADVREQVLGRLRAEQAAAAAKADGTARVAELKTKPDLALPQTLMISRTTAKNVPRPIVDAALGADVTKGPAAVGVDLGGQGYAVLKVLRVVPRAEADPEFERARPFVSQALAGAESAAFVEALKRRFKVEQKLPPAAAADAASAASAGN